MRKTLGRCTPLDMHAALHSCCHRKRRPARERDWAARARARTHKSGCWSHGGTRTPLALARRPTPRPWRSTALRCLLRRVQHVQREAPGLSVRIFSRMLLEKIMKAESGFFGALGSLSGLPAFFFLWSNWRCLRTSSGTACSYSDNCFWYCSLRESASFCSVAFSASPSPCSRALPRRVTCHSPCESAFTRAANSAARKDRLVCCRNGSQRGAAPCCHMKYGTFHRSAMCLETSVIFISGFCFISSGRTWFENIM